MLGAVQSCHSLHFGDRSEVEIVSSQVRPCLGKRGSVTGVSSGCSIISVLLLQLMGRLPGVFGVPVSVAASRQVGVRLLSHRNCQREAAGLVLME